MLSKPRMPHKELHTLDIVGYDTALPSKSHFHMKHFLILMYFNVLILQPLTVCQVQSSVSVQFAHLLLRSNDFLWAVSKQIAILKSMRFS